MVCVYVLLQASEGVRLEEQVVVLGSKLSQSQQTRLAKLGHLLGGKRADAFSCSGNLPVHYTCTHLPVHCHLLQHI